MLSVHDFFYKTVLYLILKREKRKFKVKCILTANEGSTKRPQYKGYFHAASAVLRSKGFSGLYQGALNLIIIITGIFIIMSKGLSAHLVASPISWGMLKILV